MGIEKICCPILNEHHGTTSRSMGRPEVFVKFREVDTTGIASAEPVEILGCPYYDEKKCTSEYNKSKECLYSKGFKSLK